MQRQVCTWMWNRINLQRKFVKRLGVREGTRQRALAFKIQGRVIIVHWMKLWKIICRDFKFLGFIDFLLIRFYVYQRESCNTHYLPLLSNLLLWLQVEDVNCFRKKSKIEMSTGLIKQVVTRQYLKIADKGILWNIIFFDHFMLQRGFVIFI